MNSKLVLHISDLHFGKINANVLDSLLQLIKTHKIDCVVATGDLTQRARSKQFMEAVEFLKKVEVPVLAVPGNHDVPLFNLIQRFFFPFRKYNKYIKPFWPALFKDDHMVIAGITTNNIYTVKEGKISKKEIEDLESVFREHSTQQIRIIACHHPVFRRLESSGGIRDLQERVLKLNPHLILSGHDHQSSVEFIDLHNKSFPLLVNAGTATSSRTRTEANSVNLIEINLPEFIIKNYVLEGNAFELKNETKFSG